MATGHYELETKMEELSRAISRTLKAETTQTASFGATVNYRLSRRLPSSKAAGAGSSALLPQRRPAAAAAIVHRAYPAHAEEAYMPLRARPVTKGKPWATSVVGGGIGVSHSHAEYNAQANTDFRHYVKKAYRRMHYASDMSACTERSGDSDPDVPQFMANRKKLVLTRNPARGREGGETAASVPPPPPPPPPVLQEDEVSLGAPPEAAAARVLRRRPHRAAEAAAVVKQTSFAEVPRDPERNSYFPKRHADVVAQRDRRPERHTSASINLEWSELAAHGRRGGVGAGGKRQMQAPQPAPNQERIGGVAGFGVVPAKPLRKRWSKEALRAVAAAAKRQQDRSATYDAGSEELYAALREGGAEVAAAAAATG